MSEHRLTTEDRSDLIDLVHRYAHLVDDRRVEELSELFAPDARLEFVSTGLIADGRQAISEFFTAVFATPALASAPQSGAESTHLMANTIIEAGDEPGTARLVTAAVVYLAANGVVTTRGITYTDRCRQVEGRWLLAHRVHRLRWQGEHGGGPISTEASPLD